MEISQKILGLSIVLGGTILLTYSFYHFVLCIYHWNKIVRNVKNKNAQYLGASLLTSSNNFNKEGNQSLYKSKKHLTKFLYAFIPLVLFLVVTSFLRANAN